MTTFTHSQFSDIVTRIFDHGQFSVFPGLDALQGCEEIAEPDGGEYGLVLFLKDNQPFAVYEHAYGFMVLPFFNDIPLTEPQFADLSDWIRDNGTFRRFVELDFLQGTEAIYQPGGGKVMFDTDTIFFRNGYPVALEIDDEGYRVIG